MNAKRWAATARVLRAAAAVIGGSAALMAHANLVVGQVAPMSGAQAIQGRAYAQGMRLYFEQVNKSGGVHGQNVELTVLDDLGHPDETVEKTRKLIQEARPVVLAGFFGNSNMAALLDSKLLDASSVPVVGYQSTDTRVLSSGRFFGTRAGLSEQINKIATHLATVGITRLALVFEERADAQALKELVTQAIAPSGAQLLSSSAIRSKSSMEKAVDELRTAQPTAQAVLMVASSTVTAAFVETYRLEGGNAQIYATAEADIEQLAKRLPTEYISGLSIAQVVPSPYKVTSKLNKDFRDAVLAAGPKLQAPVSFAMMEGYVNAKVIVEAMRRSQPVTPEKITAALRSLETYDLGGYWVGYRSGSQTGSRYVDLSIVNTAGRVTQ